MVAHGTNIRDHHMANSKKSGLMPTKRQIIAELKESAESWRTSYRESDGKVYDTRVLHSIRCIEAAIVIVRHSKVRRGR